MTGALTTILAVSMLATLAAAPAAAQGRGKGVGKRGAPAGATPAPAADADQPSGGGFRQFGSWLDDASLLTPGDAWTSLSFGHYRFAGGRQTDFPIADATLGITRRLQVGASVPYYHLSVADGTQFGSVGDVYLNAKLSLVAPHGDRRVALALTPVFEVLHHPLEETSRFGLALPISAELRGDGFRVFGSSGLFSRGALFASGAIEMPAGQRWLVTAALNAMRSVRNDEAADALGIPASRIDLSGAVACFLTPSMAVFGGTGRTLGTTSLTGTSLVLTGGVSFSFTAPRPL